MNWSSGLDHILTTAKEGEHCSSELLGYTVPYLVGVIFLHSCLAVILQEGRGRGRIQFRVLGSSLPVPRRPGGVGLDGGGEEGASGQGVGPAQERSCRV